MLYREVGQFPVDYASDSRIFPLRQDRIFVGVGLVILFIIIPYFSSTYWLTAILTPILILSLASLGLNILTGYAGQLSLGTGGFMAIGASTAFNLMLRIPEMNLIAAILFSGLFTGIVGLLFGLPSFRIKGFYIIVSTLTVQYLVYWVLVTYPYFVDNSRSGLVTLPSSHYKMFGIDFSSPQGKYIITASIVVVLALLAKNMVRSAVGRNWMAVRDFDTAASVIGIKVFQSKLIAFFVSSFYIGTAGALYSYCYLGQVDSAIYDLRRSFVILFMIIIGGLGSILGSFLGAAFVYYFPIFASWAGHQLTGSGLDAGLVENLSKGVFGLIIIALVIKEPGGFAAIWNKAKTKLRNWPFPPEKAE